MNTRDEPEYKKGELIRCINNSSYADRLTIGKAYKALELYQEESGHWFVDIERDNNIGVEGVYAYRFERAKPTNEERIRRRREKCLL